jgi:ankyrin repeat protein
LFLADHGKLQQWISTPNNKGYTPLHEAAIWGNTEIVTDILERKLIDVNVGDLDGNTVLHLAGKNNHFAIIGRVIIVNICIYR